MRGFSLAVVTACVLLAASVACAQTPSPSLSFNALKDRVPQSVDTGGVRELTVRSASAPSTTAAAASRVFALVADRRTAGRVRRERNPQLSDQSLVVVVRDSTGTDLSWHIVPNPWIVRAEIPDATGRLSGQILEQGDQTASVTIPDIAGARLVTIYKPRWTGGEYMLDALGDVTVP